MQRLGLYSRQASSEKTPARIWIHAASVGEIFTVMPLLKRLNVPLVVTTTTPTGAAVLEQQALSHVQHYYLPVDFSGACQRFLTTTNVSQGWIVETEIWPWLYAKAQSNHIPLTIINARLSDKTSSHARGWLASTYRQALSGVTVLARSMDDAERFRQLGAVPDSISVVGNMKYANPTTGQGLSTTNPLIDVPYLLAASTHEDEELQLSIEWCKHQKNSASETIFVIVPRHPERGAAIQKQLKNKGIAAALRSQNESPNKNHSIYIADTLGELQAWYAHAIAGFIGGSLIERGGHNMLEAARHGCPVIVGPYTHNFDDIVQMLTSHNALTIASNVQQVMTFLNHALEDPSAYTSMAERAKKQSKICETVLEDYLTLLLPH